MADSILRDKSKAFAKEIVFLCRQLRENKIEGVLINQLLKSGTSVGANVTKHNTRKVRKILFPSSKLHLRSATKANIGLNCFMKLTRLVKMNLIKCEVRVLNFAECWLRQ